MRVVWTGSQPAPAAVADVTGGTSHTLLLGSNGRMYAWGDATYGQLGTGYTGTTPVTNPVMVTWTVCYNVKQIGAGQYHSLAVAGTDLLMAHIVLWCANAASGKYGSDGVRTQCRKDNRLYAWGYNAFGQIGNNGNVDTNLPTLTLMPVGTKSMFVSAWGSSTSPSCLVRERVVACNVACAMNCARLQAEHHLRIRRALSRRRVGRTTTSLSSSNTPTVSSSLSSSGVDAVGKNPCLSIGGWIEMGA